MSLARVNKSHAINFYTDFAPPSKRSLNFHDDKKAGENGLTVNGFHQNNNIAAQTKSKKRDCDELFLPLSDDDDDANGMDKLDSTPGNERLEIKVHLHDQLSCLKSYASVNSICTLPPPQATEGHLSALSVLEVGHEQILRCPRVGHLPSLGPPQSF